MVPCFSWSDLNTHANLHKYPSDNYMIKVPFVSFGIRPHIEFYFSPPSMTTLQCGDISQKTTTKTRHVKFLLAVTIIIWENNHQHISNTSPTHRQNIACLKNVFNIPSGRHNFDADTFPNQC